MRLLSIVGIFCLSAAAQGAVVIWDGGGMNGDFDNMANWEGDVLPVSGTDTLRFISGAGAPQKTVNLNTDFTAVGAGAVTFNANTSVGGITIAGTSTLTISAGTTSAGLVVASGASPDNKITAPLVFKNPGSNANVEIHENFAVSSVDYPTGQNGRSFWTVDAGKTVTISKITGAIGMPGVGDLNFVGDGTTILDGTQSNTVDVVMKINDNGGGMNQQPTVVFAKTGGAQAYTGTSLQLSKGKLVLAGDGDNQINDAVSFLIGAIPATLDMNGHSETMGTLRSFGGTIDFSDPASENLWFQLGGASSWSGTLAITGFTPGSDTIRFGTSASGLNSFQLATITINGQAASIDSMGYLAIPEPGTIGLCSLAALGFVLRRRAVRS
jgi:hypothetical protein